jgi:CspA family cold shock protein
VACRRTTLHRQAPDKEAAQAEARDGHAGWLQDQRIVKLQRIRRPLAAGGVEIGEHLMPTGTVKWFSSTKGYGFIQPDDGSRDVFVHITAMARSGLDRLNDRQKVKFDTEPGKRPGQINAVNIQTV